MHCIHSLSAIYALNTCGDLAYTEHCEFKKEKRQ